MAQRKGGTKQRQLYTDGPYIDATKRMFKGHARYRRCSKTETPSGILAEAAVVAEDAAALLEEATESQVKLFFALLPEDCPVWAEFRVSKGTVLRITDGDRHSQNIKWGTADIRRCDTDKVRAIGDAAALLDLIVEFSRDYCAVMDSTVRLPRKEKDRQRNAARNLLRARLCGLRHLSWARFNNSLSGDFASVAAVALRHR
jgi:hypothetical protein